MLYYVHHDEGTKRTKFQSVTAREEALRFAEEQAGEANVYQGMAMKFVRSYRDGKLTYPQY